jgi:PAS domain S-box-containing protein
MQILIADDERTSTAILGSSLRQWGFDVLIAHDGHGAWQQLTEKAPSLAILDWMMPGIDGLEICRRLRDNPANSHMYLIVLTARDGRADMIKALDAGADDYLVKPVDPDELRARVQAGMRVVQAHADTRQLLASIPSILIGTDPDGRITRWNSAAEEVFGLPAPDTLGRPLTDCGIEWADTAAVAEMMSSTPRPEGSRDFVLTDRDGNRRLLSLSATRMHHGSRSSDGFVVLGEEVTDRRIIEQTARESQKLEGIGQLAAGIAHEINTPMQYIGDNLRFLEQSFEGLQPLFDAVLALPDDKGGTADARQLVTQLRDHATVADLGYLNGEMPTALRQSLEGVEHVSRIVKAMKDFSHPGTGTKVATDLNHAVQTTLTVARNELKYIADVELDLDTNLPLAQCLPGEINQVLLNLLLNAAHAIRDAAAGRDDVRGRISVSTRTVDEDVEVRIHDTGTGIPEEVRERVFEPFFTTKPLGEGTGQGLALAHTVIVKKHGGQIRFETETGAGTTFIVRLPLAPSEVAA